MTRPLDNPEVAGAMRVMRIIVMALFAGVSGFAVFLMWSNPGMPQNGLPPLTMVSAAFAAVAVVLCMQIPRMMYHKQRVAIAEGTWRQPAAAAPLQTQAGRLAAARQQTTIVSCAILEGAAFLNLCAYMTDQRLVSLLVGLLMAVLVLLQFPLADRFEMRIEDDMRWVEDYHRMKAR